MSTARKGRKMDCASRLTRNTPRCLARLEWLALSYLRFTSTTQTHNTLILVSSRTLCNPQALLRCSRGSNSYYISFVAAREARERRRKTDLRHTTLLPLTVCFSSCLDYSIKAFFLKTLFASLFTGKQGASSWSPIFCAARERALQSKKDDDDGI